MLNADDIFALNLKESSPPKKDNPAKDAICHHCSEVGHWRRNCPTYLAELLKKKQLSQGASTSVWGVEALLGDTLTKPDKLEPRSFKCIFIGYPKETMGYSFYNPSKNKVFVARNAEFFESNCIDQEASKESLREEDLKIIARRRTNPSLEH
ncbi:retrotransposon protein, putative, ty1-copia subclass [Tanacetum coccineum]